MAENWALVIGINEYNPLNFTPLKYAKRDAERVKAFFETAGFKRVFFFSDDSPRQTLPNGIEIPTQATYGNLISFLQGFFEQRFLNPGDNFWFFFAGHGERYNDEDYLMPMDANAIGSEVITGLKVNYVRERLCRCGADNVILILDACRSQGSRDGSSLGLEVQPGVITITSCQPYQKSWEVDELGQGVFTYALLEALQLPGEQSCATVERLGSYLNRRVPELCQLYRKAPAQVPRVGADPIEKQHFILIPQYARQADLDLLKLDAYRLKTTNPFLAERICIRLNALAMGRDLEVIDLLTDIRHFRGSSPSPSGPTTPPTDLASARSATLDTKTVSETERQKQAAAAARQQQHKQEEAERKRQAAERQKQANEDDLKSEKGIDYTPLRDLLKAQDWEAADRETYEVMIRAVGKKSGDWFSDDELLNFPCADLLTIDRLWVKYSQGQFGFSVQKQIYVECGGKLDGKYPGDTIWRKFGDKVGWRVNERWIRYSDVTFSTSAPVGHLPLVVGGVGWGGFLLWVVGGGLFGGGVWGECGFSSLASRLVKCKA